MGAEEMRAGDGGGVKLADGIEGDTLWAGSHDALKGVAMQIHELLV